MISIIALILFSFFFCYLSFKIIKCRRFEKIAIGDKNSDILARYISAQRNFFDYSLIFILQLFALENFAVSSLFLTVIFILFFIGRILHFLSLTKFEIKKSGSTYYFRILAMKITFVTILSSSIYLIFLLF